MDAVDSYVSKMWNSRLSPVSLKVPAEFAGVLLRHTFRVADREGGQVVTDRNGNTIRLDRLVVLPIPEKVLYRRLGSAVVHSKK